jgi:hypothetical protein
MRAARRLTSLGALASAAAILALPAAAQAAPPIITNPAFSGVTETSAILEASLDPAGSKAKATFQYTPLATYKAEGFTGATEIAAPDVPSEVKGTGDVDSGDTAVIKNAHATAGAFGPGQTLSGEGVDGFKIIRVETDPTTHATTLFLSKQPSGAHPGAALKATGPQPVAAQISGLAPGTAYRFRLIAKRSNGTEEVIGPELTLQTFVPPPTYGPCPNDPFRGGEYAPFGQPSALLPDCRAYEQATPVDKSGSDAEGTAKFIRAGVGGGSITFGSNFGIPGGSGGQGFPFYLATRNSAGSGWSTQGLYPPAATGERARFLVGFLPDFSATFAEAVKLGEPQLSALFELPADGSAPIQLTPYTDLDFSGGYAFAGASADGQVAIIEARARLAPEEGAPPLAGAAGSKASNVYAWDAAAGKLSLASAMNTLHDTETLLAKGAYAGPYGWGARRLTEGGAAAGSYATEERVVAPDGSLYFTSASNGHLYRRLNPTQAQSNEGPNGYVEGGHCAEPSKACTIDVSATEKTNGGPSQNGPDPAGQAPAAFMAASADGSTAFFTSSEKLTNDANTGPEAPQAQIGRAEPQAPDPAATVEEDFLPTHAIGLAVDPKGEYIYWVDPSKGTIGRAGLDASGDLVPGSEEPSFIDPGETSFFLEPEPVGEHGVGEELTADTAPRYVAVDEHHVYWTNTGPLAPREVVGVRAGDPLPEAGTIGRAELDPSGDLVADSVKANFIVGASDPQGIAVNSQYVYWANGAGDKIISRASIDGQNVALRFARIRGTQGSLDSLVVNASNIYFDIYEPTVGGHEIGRMPLETSGTGDFWFAEPKPGDGLWEVLGIGNDGGPGGLAVDTVNVYWASRLGMIGRVPIANYNDTNVCNANPACEREFLTPQGSLAGLATDGTHLYWSVNGEAPTNPGNDLYRYQAGATPPLTDLTAEPSGNGAEVQGVLGTSEDGSYVYFAANGALDDDGKATPGDCKTGTTVIAVTGQCNIYLWHDGTITFIARIEPNKIIEASAHGDDSEALDWAPYYDAPRGGEPPNPKRALVSPDGTTLAFISREKLTDYENRGTAELYHYHAGSEIICASCNPTRAAPPSRAEAVGYQGVTLGSPFFPGLAPKNNSTLATSTRFLAAQGNRLFFESPEALVASDTSAAAGCTRAAAGTNLGAISSCLDVYEWEAPGTGTCTEGGPAYSAANQGCLYLISPGKPGIGPAIFADASESGEDVYFFSRAQLVGQDADHLIDVYDARAGGGLTAQNPLSLPVCEVEGCKPQPTPPPEFQSPPSFAGPPDPPVKRCKGKKCKKHQPRKHHRKKKRNRNHDGHRHQVVGRPAGGKK